MQFNKNFAFLQFSKVYTISPISPDMSDLRFEATAQKKKRGCNLSERKRKEMHGKKTRDCKESKDERE